MCSSKAYIFGCVQRPIRQKYIIQIFALLTKIPPPLYRFKCTLLAGISI